MRSNSFDVSSALSAESYGPSSYLVSASYAISRGTRSGMGSDTSRASDADAVDHHRMAAARRRVDADVLRLSRQEDGVGERVDWLRPFSVVLRASPPSLGCVVGLLLVALDHRGQPVSVGVVPLQRTCGRQRRAGVDAGRRTDQTAATAPSGEALLVEVPQCREALALNNDRAARCTTRGLGRTASCRHPAGSRCRSGSLLSRPRSTRVTNSDEKWRVMTAQLVVVGPSDGEQLQLAGRAVVEHHGPAQLVVGHIDRERHLDLARRRSRRRCPRARRSLAGSTSSPSSWPTISVSVTVNATSVP